MAYIYKIENVKNKKIYIGKTLIDISKRFCEHIRDSRRACKSKRPLQLAINKYGHENFKLSEVENCSDVDASDREKYWIEYYQSFKYGYNATIGGDGRSYIDYDLVVSNYEELHNCSDVARKMNISNCHVSTILKNRNIEVKSGAEVVANKTGKLVKMLSKKGEFITSFPSLMDAGRYIVNNGHSSSDNVRSISYSIGRCAHGKRKSAFGYVWKF